MRRTSALYRVTIGRTREVRGPDAFERGCAGVIIAAVIMLAAWFGVRATRMAQSVEAVSVASGPEINEVVYFAAHGHWPAPNTPAIVDGNHGRTNGGRYVKQVALGPDGVINLQLALGALNYQPMRALVVVPAVRGVLSFRPELLGAADAPTISFLCGYAKPIAGAITNGPNATTLPRQYIPPFCR